MPVDISSPGNERIRRLVRLRDRRHRDTEGVFVVEGERELAAAARAGLQPLELYEPLGDWSDLGARSVFRCSPEALAKASYRSSPQARIAVYHQFDTSLARLPAVRNGFVLAIEGIEKPGNLGAIMRTASAFGADALVSVGAGVDVFNPNVIRASTGAVFSSPFAQAELEETLDWLRLNGMAVVAATPDGETPLWDGGFADSVAILIGSEERGLSPGALAAADAAVRIPMTGQVDSLNASVSAAIAAYEVVRQRWGR